MGRRGKKQCVTIKAEESINAKIQTGKKRHAFVQAAHVIDRPMDTRLLDRFLAPSKPVPLSMSLPYNQYFSSLNQSTQKACHTST